MRLAEKVQEWIRSLDWEDQVEENTENQTSSVNFGYGINEQSFKAWIETDEKRDWIKVYIYAPFKVLPKKFIEMHQLLNLINLDATMGAISLLDDGRLVWRHIVDFEDTDPSVKAINNQFDPGVNLFQRWFEEISAVALTKTTAQEIFDELNAPKEIEAPDEI